MKRRSPSPMISTYTRELGNWNGQGAQSRNGRTPSPYDGALMMPANQHETSRMSPYLQNNDPESEEVEVRIDITIQKTQTVFKYSVLSYRIFSIP